MATEKVVNYTEAQTEQMRAAYVAAPSKETVDSLAATLGKTTRSIVAKLSRMGIYQKPEYVTKSGAKPEKKDTTADAIGLVLGLTENDTSSLAKANKTALQAIFKALANSKPLANGEGPEDSAG